VYQICTKVSGGQNNVKPFKTHKTMKKLPPADKENARFRWKINLIDTSVQPFVMGYSKFVGNPEASEALAVFKSKIIMLHSKGWIDKATRIDFYNNQTLELLVVLKRESFDINPRLIATAESVFLSDFYKTRANNESMKELLSPKIGFSKDEYLNIDMLGKANEHRLHEYQKSLLAMGFERNTVEKFRYEWKNKYQKFS